MAVRTIRISLAAGAIAAPAGGVATAARGHPGLLPLPVSIDLSGAR